MITNKDINKLKYVFTTKVELKKFSDSVDTRFIAVLEIIENLSKEFGEFKKEMLEFKERTNKTLDWLVGAFKKFDEEHTVLTTRYSTINKAIDDHEIRISSLEKKPS